MPERIGDRLPVCRTAVVDAINSVTKPKVGLGECRNQLDKKATSRHLYRHRAEGSPRGCRRVGEDQRRTGRSFIFLDR